MSSLMLLNVNFSLSSYESHCSYAYYFYPQIGGLPIVRIDKKVRSNSLCVSSIYPKTKTKKGEVIEHVPFIGNYGGQRDETTDA